MTLRPKSDRLTGLDSSQWNYARRPLYSELPMAAFGSEERSAHEQPPAASIQKVAIVHDYIIPYLMPKLKWTDYGQIKAEQRLIPAQADCVNSIKLTSHGSDPLLLYALYHVSYILANERCVNSSLFYYMVSYIWILVILHHAEYDINKWRISVE